MGMDWRFLDADSVNEYMEKVGRLGDNWLYYGPSVVHPGEDCGIDLKAPYAFDVPAFASQKVNSFVCFDLPKGSGARLIPRGRDDFLLGSGLIDTGYTGPIIVKVINYTSQNMHFGIGDSIGQLVPYLKLPGGTFLTETYDFGEELLRGDSGSIYKGVETMGNVSLGTTSPDSVLRVAISEAGLLQGPWVDKQPMPSGGKVDVTSVVVRDIIEYSEALEMQEDYSINAEQIATEFEERSDFGVEKYGVRLHSHNGRNALVDAYQEGMDMVLYLRQHIIESDTGWELYEDVLPVLIRLRELLASENV